MAVTVERLKIELALDSSQLRRGMSESLKSVQGLEAGVGKFSSTLEGLGGSLKTFVVGALTVGTVTAAFHALGDAVKKAADAGSELVDLRDRTGFAVEALDALNYAAGQSGAKLEDLETSIKKMQKAVVEGNDKFKDLGLSLTALRFMNPHTQFLTIADAISKMEDPAQRTAAALAIFGKTGTSLLPLLKDGKNGIKAMTDEAKALGLVMSTADAEALEKFGDRLKQREDREKRFWVDVGKGIRPFADKALDIKESSVKVLLSPLTGSKELPSGARPEEKSDFQKALDSENYEHAQHIWGAVYERTKTEKAAFEKRNDILGKYIDKTQEELSKKLSNFGYAITGSGKPGMLRDLANTVGLGPTIDEFNFRKAQQPKFPKWQKPDDLVGDLKDALGIGRGAVGKLLKDNAGPFEGFVNKLGDATGINNIIAPLQKVADTVVSTLERIPEKTPQISTENRAVERGSVDAYSAEVKSQAQQQRDALKQLRETQKQTQLLQEIKNKKGGNINFFPIGGPA